MVRFFMIESPVEKLLPTLNHMKNRPGTWFRQDGFLEGLYTFLLGYSISAIDHSDLETFALGADFAQWLVGPKGFCGEASLAWGEIVRLNEPDDEAAFQLALNLISEYKEWPEIDGDLTKF